ncbi:MAG TPA: serine/threonine protein kinase [Casimicrobiaceae bacterium]|nr:serine/threonine protein kinase [Casimicrobiaceae bacterium]
MEHAHAYATLTPDRVLDALDAIGIHGDGRLLALNSYENRVYQVWRDDAPPVVAKFYRPDRWTDAQIREEHTFVIQLADAEIPVVAPLAFDGDTLPIREGFRIAVYPKRGGRAPELDRAGTLEWIGRFLGRIHAVGRCEHFAHRTALDIKTFGETPRAWLLASGMLPPDLVDVYAGVSAQAIDGIRRAFERAGDVGTLRLHGDCHVGNILWTDDGPHFVDFDDARSGPAVQDLWMLISGSRESMEGQLLQLLEGYEKFATFDARELQLIEALRTLRLIHYAAWLGQRWSDPAFPAAFPFFGTQRYWQDRILELREQIALMDEPPLTVD